jgi:hypothetical protein
MESFDFVKMTPDASVFSNGNPVEGTARALAQKGKAYAIYIHKGKPGYLHNSSGGGESRPPYSVSPDPQETSFILNLPVGIYKAEWVNTKTGKVDKVENLKISGGPATLVSPRYQEDVGLRIKRQ